MMTGTGAAVGPGLGHPDSAYMGAPGPIKEKRYGPKEGKESAIREGTWARKVRGDALQHTLSMHSINAYTDIHPYLITP